MYASTCTDKRIHEWQYIHKYTDIKKHTNLGTHTQKQNPSSNHINLHISLFLKTFYSNECVRHKTQGPKHYYVIYIYNIYYIDIVFVGPERKSKYFKMNKYTKRICFYVIHFSLTRVSSVLRRLQEVFSLICIETTVLITLWFFLIPRFASANFQFELIVPKKFSSLRKKKATTKNNKKTTDDAICK